MDSIINRCLKEIRSGFHTFVEIGNKEIKDELITILLSDYIDGTITDEAKRSLTQYYVDEIDKNHININEVPEYFRDEIINYNHKKYIDGKV